MKIFEQKYDTSSLVVHANINSYGHDYSVYDVSEYTVHMQSISFQNGTIPEVGVNGITNETLLAILIHRTKLLNDKFPCRENAIAITKMEEALMWFNKRTEDRKARNVEGKQVL